MGHKGITPIIAIIILLLIAIALAGAGWAYISMMYSGYVGKNIQVAGSYNAYGTNQIVIKNAGTEGITIENCTYSGKTAICGDITVRKVQGEGDITSMAIAEGTLDPGETLIILDGSCQKGMSMYQISTGSLSQDTYVSAPQDCTGCQSADDCHEVCKSAACINMVCVYSDIDHKEHQDYCDSANMAGSCTELPCWCVAGACEHPLIYFGDKTDGVLTVSAFDTAVNDYTHLTGNENSGETVITVDDASAFSDADGDKDEILMIQMQHDSDAGSYEFATIESISGNDITLSAPLQNNYYSGTFDTTNAVAAQVVRVPQYTNVTVNSGASMVASPWNGYSGGVVAFRAYGNVSVAGSINATGRGLRGGSQDNPDTVQYSYRGEGLEGNRNTRSRNANFGAGGGGETNRGNSCPTNIVGRAGGGGYGTAGEDGDNGCADDADGFGGGTYGSADLSSIYLGAGGGTGGHDSEQAQRYGGAGGAGGGIIYIIADELSVAGSVEANGGKGADGLGGAGGGGGAGGSIYLTAYMLSIGTDKVTGTGGISGTLVSGTGGDGRIRIDYVYPLSGTSDPAAYENDLG